MTGKPTPDELRSLRAYAAATPPMRILADKRMFGRLLRQGLVIGSIARDGRGDPIGIIRVTEAGHALLKETST